jgi:hypothetical protein
MDADKQRGRARSFMLGGLVGASAALAAARRLGPRPRRPTPAGLSAFEGAPCFQETLEEEAAAAAQAAQRPSRAPARAPRP